MKKLLIALSVASVLTITGLVVASEQATQTPVTAQTSVVQVHIPDSKDMSVAKIFDAVNAERVTHGIAPLNLSPMLNASAQAKCNDEVVRNYYAHTDPDGRKEWHFITDAGYSYNVAGENLAAQMVNEQIITDAWMNSPEHKKNILNSGFTDVGYAFCDSEQYGVLTVQHLAAPYSQ